MNSQGSVTLSTPRRHHHACIAFSAWGSHARHAHESMRALHVWACSMRILQPDLMVWECAPTFPRDLLKWWLEDIYTVQFYDMEGPEMLGHPV